MSDVAAIRNTGSRLVGQQVRDTGLGDGPARLTMRVLLFLFLIILIIENRETVPLSIWTITDLVTAWWNPVTYNGTDFEGAM